MNKGLLPALVLLVLPGTVRADAPPELNKLIPNLSRIKGLTISPKMFEHEGNSSVGLNYDYAQDFSLTRSGSWVKGSIRANGNIAFKSELNPEDFLSSRVGWSIGKTMGGTVKNSDSALVAFADVRLAATEIKDARELDRFMRSDAVHQYLRFLRPQFDVDVILDGGLESDQRFTKKQWVLGIDVLAELNLWGDAASANLFDWPFAIIRYLTGQGEFRVLGSTVPTLTLGLDLVSPQEDDPRTMLVGNEDEFLRADSEIGFRTVLAGDENDAVFLNVVWRVFKELGAESIVTDAELDVYSHVVLTVSSNSGVFVSYTDGRLPLDAENDQTYAIGWEFGW